MRTISTLLVTLLITQLSIANKYLIGLNPEWLNQEDVNLSEIHYVPRSETELIQKHLLLVTETMRARSTEGLSTSQKENRARCLDLLYEYAIEGRFPFNDKYDYRTPIFIDTQGVYCAVGHLMMKTGFTELAQQIDAHDERIFVREIHRPEVALWIEEHGLTMDECAWIQPGYGRMELRMNSRPLDIGGLTSTTPIIGRTVEGLDGLEFSASLENKGNVKPLKTDDEGRCIFYFDSMGMQHSTLQISLSDTSSILGLRYRPRRHSDQTSDSLAVSGCIGIETYTLNDVYFPDGLFGAPLFFQNNTSGNIQELRIQYSDTSQEICAENFNILFLMKQQDPSVSIGISAFPFGDSYKVGSYTYPNYGYDPTNDQMEVELIAIRDLLIRNAGIADFEVKLTAESHDVRVQWTVPAEPDDKFSVTLNHYEESKNKHARLFNYTQLRSDSGESYISREFLHQYLDTGWHAYTLDYVKNNEWGQRTKSYNIYIGEDENMSSSTLRIIGSNIVDRNLEIIYSEELAEKEIEVINEAGEVVIVAPADGATHRVLSLDGLLAGSYFLRVGREIKRFYLK